MKFIPSLALSAILLLLVPSFAHAQQSISFKCEMVGYLDRNRGQTSTLSVSIDQLKKTLRFEGQVFTFDPAFTYSKVDEKTYGLGDLIFEWNDSQIVWGRKVWVDGQLQQGDNPYYYTLDRDTGMLTSKWSKGPCKKAERLF